MRRGEILCVVPFRRTVDVRTNRSVHRRHNHIWYPVILLACTPSWASRRVRTRPEQRSPRACTTSLSPVPSKRSFIPFRSALLSFSCGVSSSVSLSPALPSPLTLPFRCFLNLFLVLFLFGSFPRPTPPPHSSFVRQSFRSA